MASQRQIEANRKNRTKRQGLTPEGRERLREAALRNRPWEHSTGPRTEAGKRRSRENAVFSGRHCRTVEPFASIDRLKRLLARQAYHHARLALMAQRSLGMRSHGINATKLAKLPVVCGAAFIRNNSAFDRVAEMLGETASCVEVIKEEEPLRREAWRRVAALFEMPLSDSGDPAEQSGPQLLNAGSAKSDRASDKPSLAVRSSRKPPSDLVLCDRLIQHVASRPVTLASFAVAGLFEPIVNNIVWPGIAGIGLWDRTYQRMARRDD